MRASAFTVLAILAVASAACSQEPENCADREDADAYIATVYDLSDAAVDEILKALTAAAALDYGSVQQSARTIQGYATRMKSVRAPAEMREIRVAVGRAADALHNTGTALQLLRYDPSLGTAIDALAARVDAQVDVYVERCY